MSVPFDSSPEIPRNVGQMESAHKLLENRSKLTINSRTVVCSHLAFDFDLCVGQPPRHFFHKRQVKQMIFKPTEQGEKIDTQTIHLNLQQLCCSQKRYKLTAL